ncbi:hypothetical protein E2C01_077037 [Portunus trituberculatus]|uniref:Uncharacterized protein n=1 Tax=Portunus trituberculatus TaxID=210409 RepID=A0A5B7IQ86_PORTR|nr:hypothetical protein [Portunus trituberculatus]
MCPASLWQLWAGVLHGNGSGRGLSQGYRDAPTTPTASRYALPTYLRRPDTNLPPTLYSGDRYTQILPDTMVNASQSPLCVSAADVTL